MKEFFESTGGRLGAAAFAALIFIVALGLSMRKNKMSVKVLAYSAMLMALATILSNFGYPFPSGGSITFLSMFFVILAGLWFGPSVGLTVGICYGLLQFAIKPYFYHPAQFFFDYILGFGALGLSGFFKGRKYSYSLGVIIPMFMRFVFSSISGYIFFSEWAWEGWSPLAYTVVYNGGYVFTEMALTLVIISFPQVRSALDRVGKTAM